MNTEFIRILSSAQHERQDLFFCNRQSIGNNLAKRGKRFLGMFGMSTN